MLQKTSIQNKVAFSSWLCLTFWIIFFSSVALPQRLAAIRATLMGGTFAFGVVSLAFMAKHLDSYNDAVFLKSCWQLRENRSTEEIR